MADPKKDEPKKDEKTITVKTIPGVERFCRAGRCFGQEPVQVVIAELPKGGLEALRAEPRLVVEE